MTELNIIGNSFMGEVAEISIDDMDNFLMDNYDQFEDTGKRSFLKIAGIPYSFFQKMPDTLQRDILTARKQDVREMINSIYLLSQENQIMFSARKTDLEIVDPVKLFKMDLDSGWIIRTQCFHSGMYQYVTTIDRSIKDEFTPALFLNIPILYNGKITLALGLYKVNSQTALLDKNPVSISTADFPSEEVITSFFSSLYKSISPWTSTYDEMVKYFKSMPLTSATAWALLDEIVDGENPLPISKRITNKSYKHLDLIAQKAKIDPPEPTKMESVYDLVDVLTWYSKEIHLTARIKAETLIFNYFYNLYLKENDLKPQKLILKSLLKGAKSEVIKK